jgi:CcmD family protein
MTQETQRDTQPPAPAASTVDDRATTFQAVQGGEAPHYSGEVLLVSAYAILWVILLGWVAFLWRKQSELNGRLGDLERVLDQAASKAAAEGGKGPR